MALKEMDPDKIRELLKGHVDVLTPLANKEAEMIKSASCPNCGLTEVQPMLDRGRPFSPGALLPNKVLHCLNCKTEFDPKNNIITKAPITIL